MHIIINYLLYEQVHIEECPSRDNFDRYVYNVGTNQPSQSAAPRNEPQPERQRQDNDDDDDEDWE